MNKSPATPNLDLGPAYSETAEPEEVLRWALTEFHPGIALAASFEHTVLIHMMATIRKDVRVFSIDTGRLPEETFQCATEVERRFGIPIEWYVPDTAHLERLVHDHGIHSFRRSLEDRQLCCQIRKVEPLGRALRGLRAWITGLRRDEAATRSDLQLIERDAAHGNIIKINPLAHWTHQQVREYTRKHQLPYNRLFDRGYTSIGCACCTRAIQPGDDVRAGRWWWENPDHKECGLHPHS